jgi:hypothetical protein
MVGRAANQQRVLGLLQSGDELAFAGGGRRNPTVVTLFELAAALGVGHVELVTPDEESMSAASPPPKRRIGKSRKS